MIGECAMRLAKRRKLPMAIAGSWLAFLTFGVQLSTCFAFEGRIQATLTRGGETQTFIYTAGTNQLRIERGETDQPYPQNIVNRGTGELTLLFPHNRSFVRLKPAGDNTASFPTAPAMPAPSARLPSGIGPQPSTGNLPPQQPAMPQMPAMPPRPAGVTGIGVQPGLPAGLPSMPTMPVMPMAQAELKATEDTTNLLGYTCTRYELKSRNEVMDIWATDRLLPFRAWLPNQPHRFGPRMIEDQWGEMLAAKKLFPLLATLKFGNGIERLRFEVRTVTPEKEPDPNGALFQPPPDYREIQPLPF